MWFVTAAIKTQCRLNTKLLVIQLKRYSSFSQSEVQKIRNIGIIAHIDAGKTTTTERILHYAGFTKRIGDVDSGSTVTDYLPQERERGITINSAAITFNWNNHRINLIDTPGHVDFTFEVERSLRVLDGAVTILDGVAGVEAQTETVWSQANRYRIPRIVFVNKMDREGANYFRTIDMMKTKLGKWGKPVVCQIPVFGHDEAGMGKGQGVEGDNALMNMQSSGTGFDGIIDVVRMEVLNWKSDPSGALVKRIKLPKESVLYEQAVEARSNLIDELSDLDDELLEKFLEFEDPLKVTEADLKSALKRVTMSGKGVPVFCGASFKNLGVQPLMDAVLDYLPSPIERGSVLAVDTKGKELEVKITDKKFCALAFKVVNDAKRGPLVFVRVYSGSLNNRATVFNSTQNCKERINKLLEIYADESQEITNIGPGNIGVIVGLKQTKTGDTLLLSTEASKPIKLQGPPIPPPVFFCSIQASSTSEEKVLADALQMLVKEDPSVKVSIDADTGQTLISGMGELHLEITKDRLISQYKVNATTGKMRIGYREGVDLLEEKVEERVIYERDMNGKLLKAGMSGSLKNLNDNLDENDHDIIRLNESGQLLNEVVVDIKSAASIQTSSIPPNPASSSSPSSPHEPEIPVEESTTKISQTAQTALSRGPLLGFPLTNLSLTLSSLESFGPELTTPVAITNCTHFLVKKLLSNGTVYLMEPVMQVDVAVPDKYVGSVVRDITGKRRGKMLGMENLNENEENEESYSEVSGKQIVKANIPLSELIGYSSTLRSLTGGAGTFTMKLIGYGRVGTVQQEAVIKELKEES
ncbi:P-loop containing nucleoside triphosphate hydrolase protein [Paraphysoderma sedebokerense]|nr:P-loop containing nucleoside triphosphate hydrolase protein [Paraphysoderma sedebokerense]